MMTNEIFCLLLYIVMLIQSSSICWRCL